MLTSSLRLALALHALQLALAVLAGAFGAHALKQSLSEAQLIVWQTGVLYHLIHALGGLIVGGLGLLLKRHQFVYASWGLHIGIVLFCGSLYGLTLTGARFLGPVTPLGGICFVGIWIYVAYTIITAKLSPQ